MKMGRAEEGGGSGGGRGGGGGRRKGVEAGGREEWKLRREGEGVKVIILCNVQVIFFLFVYLFIYFFHIGQIKPRQINA